MAADSILVIKIGQLRTGKVDRSWLRRAVTELVMVGVLIFGVANNNNSKPDNVIQAYSVSWWFIGCFGLVFAFMGAVGKHAADSELDKIDHPERYQTDQ